MNEGGYPHPALEPILEDTYGIIVYQEQIMQIASDHGRIFAGRGGFAAPGGGKKKREILDKAAQITLSRAASSQGHTAEADANSVYDMIVRFADYGFSRAHAAAYAVLAFQTAYLKAHYPVLFMASMLTSVIGTSAKRRNMWMNAGDGHRCAAAGRERKRRAVYAGRRRGWFPCDPLRPRRRSKTSARKRSRAIIRERKKRQV